MTLRFNTLLDSVGVAPSAVRLLRHQDSRAERGRTPYALWRDDRPAFEAYQEGQGPVHRARLRGDYWAAFVVSPAGETLFAGLYAARYIGLNTVERIWPHAQGSDPVGACDVYDLTVDERMQDFAGRVVIAWGEGSRSWIQRADLQDKPVLAIHETFKEPDFPGYTRLIASLSEVEAMPANWTAALSSARGVYLLTCPVTKEQYVGSATGEGGFHSRWLDYARTGHGGNLGLKSRDPSDYQVSILEVAGSSATPEDILQMEVLWKRKLQSCEMGLNRN